MAGRSTSYDLNHNLYDSQIEVITKWLSCNGEIWGIGPTAVFASAAALFLFNELEAAIFVTGDHVNVSVLEKSLISSMVFGMLALMIHLWVCSMRLFEYYLDTLIKDSPNMLLEMTTAGLLGSPPEMMPLGPLTRFLRQQQPQIHITVCWFLSLCYADYVRKHYCQSFNMPYLEQWQTELHERASRGVHRTMEKVHSFVGAVHQRLRGYAQPAQLNSTEAYTVRARRVATRPRWRSLGPPAGCRGAGRGPPGVRGVRAERAGPRVAVSGAEPCRTRSCACGSSASPAKRPLMRLKDYELILGKTGVDVLI